MSSQSRDGEPVESDRLGCGSLDFVPPNRASHVLFAGFFNAIWGLLLLRLFGVFESAPRVALASLGLLSALLLASLVVENLSDDGTPRGVIVAAEVVGRRGEATTYEPSFTEPLHAGVECTVKERRDGWWLIELDDERETWVPSSTVGVVGRP